MLRPFIPHSSQHNSLKYNTMHPLLFLFALLRPTPEKRQGKTQKSCKSPKSSIPQLGKYKWISTPSKTFHFSYSFAQHRGERSKGRSSRPPLLRQTDDAREGGDSRETRRSNTIYIRACKSHSLSAGNHRRRRRLGTLRDGKT